jgi:hypothetical protein
MGWGSREGYIGRREVGERDGATGNDGWEEWTDPSGQEAALIKMQHDLDADTHLNT